MEEKKSELWEEEFRIRCATLHYLGLLIAVVGFIIIIMGLFDPDVHVSAIMPGDDAPIWGTVFFGLAMLLGGGAVFLFIEE